MKEPEILKGEKGVLFATLAGLVLSDIIPTPGDALYFYLNRKYRNEWTEGKLTSKQYWLRETLSYYTLNSSWWLLVGFATFYTPGTVQNKFKTFLALAGGGAVVGIIFKNIKKDEIENLSAINLEKENLYKEKNGKV